MAQLADPHRILCFGSFEIDIVSGELRRQGLKIRLQDQPFRLLVLLVGRAGDVVTREEVREKLWPADTYVDFDHSLNTAVRKLREALGDSAEAPRYVETLARAVVTGSSLPWRRGALQKWHIQPARTWPRSCRPRRSASRLPLAAFSPSRSSS
jgi:hypothetical protein